MAEVAYNGITLPWVRTESCHSEVVYKDADYVHTRHVLTVDLLIARGTPGVFLSTGESLADAIRRIRHALETPRRPFSFTINGIAVLQADPTSDTNNGPLPEVIGITRFVGSESASVRFRITVHKRDCEGMGESPPYLTHKWSESADIGEDFRTAYRRSGSLMVGSNATINGQPVGSVDQFRYLVVPPIPFGFTFKHGNFNTSPDGLTLTYDLEYEERDLGTMPPPPAVQASGSNIVTTSNNGAKKYITTTVRLVGHPWSNKQALLLTAIAVAMRCVDRARPARDKASNRGMITGHISEQLYKNEIEVQLYSLIDMQDAAVAVQPDSSVGLLPPNLTSPGNPTGNEIGKQDGSTTGGAGRGNDGGIRPGNSKTGPADAFTSGALSASKPPPPLAALPATAKPGGPTPDNGMMIPKGLVPYGLGQYPLYSEPNRAKTPDPGLRATAGLRLISALVNDPCVSLQENQLEGNAFPGFFGELVASAPGGDLSRYLTGFTARSTPVVAAVVPDLEEAVLQQQRQLPKPPGAGYTDYRLHLEYSIDPNLCSLPEQKTKGLTHFIPLAAEQVFLTVRWSTERVGDVPAIPDRNSPDPNMVFLGGSASPGDIDLAPDGYTLIVRSAGWWKFGFKDPSLVKFGAGMAPWITAICGGPPLPVIIGGPAFLQQAIEDVTDAVDLIAGLPIFAGIPTSQLGDFVPDWSQIWAGFLGGVSGGLGGLLK